jgi:hypothetical protein
MKKCNLLVAAMAICCVQSYAESANYEKVTELTSGSYIFVVNEDGLLRVANPLAANYAYGSMALTEASVDGDLVVADDSLEFQFVVADGRTTIKDVKTERYYGMDKTHKSWFMLYDYVSSGCYYTFSFTSTGELELTNYLNTDCSVCQGRDSSNSWEQTLAPASGGAGANLPMLYKKSVRTAVEIAAADSAYSAAPAVYYNLQGQRVAAPVSGCFIRVRGGKAEKVFLP